MSELDDVLSKIHEKFEVETVPLKIEGKTMQILQIKDLGAYIERLADTQGVGFSNFPYWAKIWESSFLLAYFMGQQPVVPKQRLLEIGAGLGVVGVYAALCGHRVLITDINDDALLFAKANVLLNGALNAEVLKLDWNAPELPAPYDVVFGSEVIYDRENYPLLVKFLGRALTPDGMIFLAKNAGLNTPKFFGELTKYFVLKQMSRTIRTGDEPQTVELFAIRKKPDADI